MPFRSKNKCKHLKKPVMSKRSSFYVELVTVPYKAILELEAN